MIRICIGEVCVRKSIGRSGSSPSGFDAHSVLNLSRAGWPFGMLRASKL